MKLKELRRAFDDMLIKEVKQYGGIPAFACTPEQIKLRTVIAELLLDEVSCMDCGKAYGGPDWLDASLSNEQWKMLHPTEGGILCANCIVARASRLPGVIRMVARIEFASEVENAMEGSSDL